MSLESVKKDLARWHAEQRIVTLDASTATVDEAARAHGVDPDQIAKTLSFKLDDRPLLIVVSGRARIDNPKYKAHFSHKARMLNPEEVLHHTGHAVGAVCPFGLKEGMDVYLDVSLKKHHEVIPAAGDTRSAIRLTLAELERFSGCKAWIDVCQ